MTCGRLSYCDDHHPLGRAHVPSVTISACVRTCHRVLNERQAIAGMVRDHSAERGEAEQVWAFASGLADVLFVRGLGSTRIGEAQLDREQLEIATLGRALDLVMRAVGDPGISGPNPRKTSTPEWRGNRVASCLPASRPRLAFGTCERKIARAKCAHVRYERACRYRYV